MMRVEYILSDIREVPDLSTLLSSQSIGRNEV